MIPRIRKGNDFHVAWQIKRGGVAENLENVTDIKLERTIYGITTDHTLFTVSGDTITAEIPAEVQTHYGQYKLTLSYELVDTGMSDDDRKCKVAVYAFAIVDPLGPADDLLTVDVASDVSIGFKGDKGLSAYQVWLEDGNVGTEDDYFAYLRQPATDAAASLSTLEHTVSGNETARINAESDRVDAEDLRDQAEVSREAAEGLRQTNTTTAIQDAEQATTAANTAAGLANNAATAANTAAGDANDAAGAANTAAGLANNAATAANTAAGDANDAAGAANTAAGLADTARTELTTAVNTKLGEADGKIEEMNTTLSTYDGRVTQVESDIDQLAGNINEMIVGELGTSETKGVSQKIATDTINVYNVTKLHPLESEQYYTLSTAAFNVPSSARKSGIIITYESSSGIWEIKRFTGDVSTEWGFTESKWIDLNTYKKSVGYIVAAFDSSAEEKKYADFVAESEVNGFTQIYAAISALGASGGTVVLMNGTYSSPNDAGISISKANVTIEGQGYGTLLKRGGGGTGAAIITQSGGNNLIVRNLSVNTFINTTNGEATGGFIENVIENTTHVVRRPELPTPYVLSKLADGIAGINTAIGLLPSTGGTIVLERGVYTGSAGVNLNKDNIIIQGQGRVTEIKRDGSGVNDVFNNTNKRGCILKDLSLTRITRPSFPSEFDTTLQNCWLNGVYMNESQQSIANVITVGKNQQFAKLSQAYNSIDTSKPLPSATNKYEIHVYGYVKEENLQLQLHKRFVDIIGHNATIELYNTNAVYGLSIVDNRDAYPSSSEIYGEINDSTYKDIHFLRTGEIDGYNFPCASLSSSNIQLINCKFENRTTSTHEYDPLIPSGSDDVHGARRHGIVINIPRYQRECNTRLINCIGIGSPFGFQNTRGIYIFGGSPKLYNCIGIAGGLGERSHGIICHRYSAPILYNCIGYGSIYSDRQSNGIQCQSMANPIMYNCIGFAGSPDDSAGICIWSRSQPKLFNCIGFSGQGENSVGLEIANNAKPFVKEGYFGVEDKSFVIDFVKDSGQNYQTFKPISEIPYTVSNVVLWLVSPSTLPTGTTFSIETVEDTPQIIIDKVLCDNTFTAMLFPVMTITSVSANVMLKIIWRDASENIISVPNGVIRTQIVYNYNQSGGSGLLIKSDPSPEILGAVFESNENSDCLSIMTSAKNYNFDRCVFKSRNENNNAISALSELTDVPIFNSRIQGQLSNVTSFKAKTQILDSSNYGI